jgi:hypothetical protein
VVGGVHVFVATEATEDRLTKQSRQRVLAVLAGARVNQFVANHVRQSGCNVVKSQDRPGNAVLCNLADGFEAAANRIAVG